MSEYQTYYEAFKSGYWACENAAECPCHGNGWALSEVDTWHTCRVHYVGQMHPDACDAEMSADDMNRADLASRTEWAVKRGKATFLPAFAPEVYVSPVIDNEIPF